MNCLDDVSSPPLLTSSTTPLDLSTGLQKKLKAFIHKRVLNPEDADDIFQVTCLEAWRSKDRFNGQATLSPESDSQSLSPAVREAGTLRVRRGALP